MTYYAPLRFRTQRDFNSRDHVENSLNRIEHGYFYHGKRIGKDTLIDLSVCTYIVEAEENLFLRSCLYSGDRGEWKEIIKQQLIKHLQDIGVENGIAKAETRYFEVENGKQVTKETYEKELLELMAKVAR